MTKKKFLNEMRIMLILCSLFFSACLGGAGYVWNKPWLTIVCMVWTGIVVIGNVVKR